MPKAIAACDKHLVNLLLTMVAEGTQKKLNVRNLAKPDPHYTCSCKVPAQWYISHASN